MTRARKHEGAQNEALGPSNTPRAITSLWAHLIHMKRGPTPMKKIGYFAMHTWWTWQNYPLHTHEGSVKRRKKERMESLRCPSPYTTSEEDLRSRKWPKILGPTFTPFGIATWKKKRVMRRNNEEGKRQERKGVVHTFTTHQRGTTLLSQSFSKAHHLKRAKNHQKREKNLKKERVWEREERDCTLEGPMELHVI